MSVRAVSIAGDNLPITDGSIQITRNPLVEAAMTGRGGEKVYKGLYNTISGSFGGAYRPYKFSTYLNDMMKVTPPTYNNFVVVDDFGNALTVATVALTGAELSVKAGDYARINFSWVGNGPNPIAAGSAASGDYSGSIPVFSNSYIKISTAEHKANAFTLKVDRPYSADDFVMATDIFISQSLYQSGDTNVNGTITLTQDVKLWTGIMTDADVGTTFEFHFGTACVYATNAVLTGINESISGRGLIQKTYNWSCPSNQLSFGV